MSGHRVTRRRALRSARPTPTPAGTLRKGADACRSVLHGITGDPLERGLFERYIEEPDTLPGSATSRATAAPHVPVRQRAREVADYIAGMTDRFALREHERLTGQRLFD